MEQASQALVARDYFETERLAASALRKAHALSDYDRMARILMPLQEARRQKRDLAFDAGKVALINSVLPEGRDLHAGCYLVAPPRVGVDGRTLREMADQKKVATIVIVREPTSRDGLWPLVAVGPVTLRAKVPPPDPTPPPPPAKPAKKTAKAGGAAGATPGQDLPPREWFIEACEALGDAAIEAVAETLPAATRVDHLMERLEALPDHEKLHQRLAEAARQALLEPPRKRKQSIEDLLDEEEGPDEDGDDGDD